MSWWTHLLTLGRWGLAVTLCALPCAAGVLGVAAPVRPNAEPVAHTRDARSTYVLHCAGCHGMDGAGSVLGQVPDMRQMGGFLRVPGGRQFVIQVPGVMGSGLNDEQVAQVTNWMFQHLVQGWDASDFVPYTAQEVALARRNHLQDVMGKRQWLVEQAQRLGFSLR